MFSRFGVICKKSKNLNTSTRKTGLKTKELARARCPNENVLVSIIM